MEHTAPGPAAGYLFQPERALLHLARRGVMVGIETSDDVVSHLSDGHEIREQAKHTIVGQNPFTDRSRDLWRTLAIWLEAIKREDVDPDDLKLFLVTNATVSDGLATTLARASEPEDINEAVKALRETAVTVGGRARESAQAILAADTSALTQLVACIAIVDGNEAAGTDLRGSIADHINIPDEFNSEDIIQSLLGWVHAVCMELWRAGKPAWLTRTAFKRQVFRVISRHAKNRIVERTVAAIPISNSERRKYANRLFLRQIELLEFPEATADDYLLDALDDFIRCLSERTRLLEDGRVTGEDLTDFEERLYQRWQSQSRRIWSRRKENDTDSDCDCGRRLYQESIEHRETLAGVPTEQYYLTRGSLHRLADRPRLGWHPNYRSILRDYAREPKTN